MEQFRSVLGGFPSCEKSKVWRNAHSILPLYKTTHDNLYNNVQVYMGFTNRPKNAKED